MIIYKHILFDFGGVLLDMGGKHTLAPDHLAKIFGVTAEEVEDIWKHTSADLVRGKIQPKQYLAYLNERLGKNANIDKAYDEWRSMMKLEKDSINWQLIEYIKHLKKHYKIHMLSDTLGLDIPREKWVDEIDVHFDNRFLSHEQKTKKPDHHAFINALNKIGAKPEECIFIDDHRPNVEAAKKLKITSIQFKDFYQLKEEMRRLGVE